MPKPITNQQLVKKIMTTSRFGPLAEVVVIEALAQYTSQVIANEEEFLRKTENFIIHGPSWVSVCKEIKQQIENRNA